jgi:hypothetical protein
VNGFIAFGYQNDHNVTKKALNYFKAFFVTGIKVEIFFHIFFRRRRERFKRIARSRWNDSVSEEVSKFLN